MITPEMMPSDTSDEDHFEDLLRQGRTALARGELERALEICDEAEEWAKRHGSRSDVDLVAISRNSVLLKAGHGDSVIRDLQKILMRSGEAKNRHLAAYNISFRYELDGDFEKSRFYARIALDHAGRAESSLLVARSHTLLGNLQIRESRFLEALESYEHAMEHFTTEQLYERLAVLAGMGYCHLACGQLIDGFEKLFRVRREYIRLRLTEGMALGRLRLSFCFGYLEMGKFHQAILHGKAGLAIGEGCGDHDLVKKALFLIGEAQKQSGLEMAAYTYFARLQEEYYPDNPYLPDLLLESDVNKLVNVWA